MYNTMYDKVIKLFEELGTDDPIWKYQDYRDVLEMCRLENIVILGGDIIVHKNGVYEYESSSWYYNGESVTESITVANNYLSTYPADGDTFVAYVFK